MALPTNPCQRAVVRFVRPSVRAGAVCASILGQFNSPPGLGLILVALGSHAAALCAASAIAPAPRWQSCGASVICLHGAILLFLSAPRAMAHAGEQSRAASRMKGQRRHVTGADQSTGTIALRIDSFAHGLHPAQINSCDEQVHRRAFHELDAGYRIGGSHRAGKSALSVVAMFESLAGVYHLTSLVCLSCAFAALAPEVHPQPMAMLVRYLTHPQGVSGFERAEEAQARIVSRSGRQRQRGRAFCRARRCRHALVVSLLQGRDQSGT